MCGGETGNISGEQPGCGKAEGTGQLPTGYGDRCRGGGQVPAEDGWLGVPPPRPGCGHAPCPLRRTGTAPDPAQADAPDVAS